MNSIEELQNLVELMQQALKFYADKNNYIPTSVKNSLSDRYLTYIEVDEGSQARFAIEKIEELKKINQKMQNDYDKIVAEGLSTWTEETNLEDIKKIIEEDKIIDNNNK
jgi:hypothetical protein